MDLSGINYSENDFKDSYCLEFTSKTEIGGAFNDNLLKIVIFILRPCIPGVVNNCQAQRYDENGLPVGPPVTTVNSDLLLSENSDLFAEYMKDFTLEFGYIEETPGLEKFEEPVIRNIV